MPISPISPDEYAVNFIKNVKQAHSEFGIIMADVRRSQRDHYDSISRHIEIPTGNHTKVKLPVSFETLMVHTLSIAIVLTDQIF